MYGLWISLDSMSEYLQISEEEAITLLHEKGLFESCDFFSGKIMWPSDVLNKLKI